MGAKSKPGKVRKAARKVVARASGRRGRAAAAAPDSWAAQVFDDRDDEIDCQRIVDGYGGRNLPSNYDEYN